MLGTSRVLPPASFGNTVRRLRILQGMTHAELGERSKLSAMKIEALEFGHRVASLGDLYSLGAGLGMEVSAIMRVWETSERAKERK